MLDYIIVPIILIFGYGFKNRFRFLNAYDHRILDLLYFYHMIMSLVFYLYIRTNGGDAIGYWEQTREHDFTEIAHMMFLEQDTTASLWFFTHLPSKILGLDFFTGCMIFGVIGYIGLLYLYLIIKKLFPLNQFLSRVKILNFSIFPTLLFLPNFHFWSGGIGKDTLVFFAISIVMYSLLSFRKYFFLLLLGVLISYFIRPHITLMIFTGFGVAFLLKSNLMKYQKFFLILFASILFFPLLSKVLEFVKIEEATLESFDKFSSHKSEALASEANSGIDLAGLPYPLQVLTFLYRPLFFDARNILSLLASIENLVWITLSLNFFNNNPFRTFKKSHFLILGSFLFWLIGALTFAPVMSNLGIIIRERNMFLPAFILFAIAGLANTKKFRKYEWWLAKEKEKYYANQPVKE